MVLAICTFFFGGAIRKATYGSLFLKKGHFLMPKRPPNEEVGDFFQSDPQIVLSIVSFEVKSYCNFGGHFGHCEASVVSSGPMASEGPKWIPPKCPLQSAFGLQTTKSVQNVI